MEICSVVFMVKNVSGIQKNGSQKRGGFFVQSTSMEMVRFP